MKTNPAQVFLESAKGYFNSEKKSGVSLAIYGLVCLLASLYLYKTFPEALTYGALFPLVIFGLIHLIDGASMFIKSEMLIRSMEKELNAFPKKMVIDELLRMEKATFNFNMKKNIEMMSFFLGFALFLIGMFYWGDFMMGTGAALTWQAAVSLVFDLFASLRCTFYQRALIKFKATSPWI